MVRQARQSGFGDRHGAIRFTVETDEQPPHAARNGAGHHADLGPALPLFFGQLAFQTSNFMGRGESLTLSMQAGSRAEQYQVAFTEPFGLIDGFWLGEAAMCAPEYSRRCCWHCCWQGLIFR